MKGKNKMKRYGFTLAEVMITLAVIGVVSALTVPNLVGNASKKGQVALLRKAHVELEEAIQTEMAERDLKNLKNMINTDEKVNSFLIKYYKVTTNCGLTTSSGSSCLGSSIYNINGDAVSIPTGLTCITNAAGITVCMGKSSNDGYGEILVDVNGKKDPNIVGRDVFGLSYQPNGDVVDGINLSVKNQLEELYEQREAGEITEDQYIQERDEITAQGENAETCINGVNLYGCFGTIVNSDWEMTY